jgi:phage anti-repressor protein
MTMILEISTVELLVFYKNQLGDVFVNALDLHKTLMIEEKFSIWIKRKIALKGFFPGVDFLTKQSKNDGHSSTEYLLSIHAATITAKASFDSNETSINVLEYLNGVESRFGLEKSPSSPAEVLVMFAKQLVEQEKSINEVKLDIRELKQQGYIWDNLDTNGDQQQQFQKVNRYAAVTGIPFSLAWKEFKKAFNIAFKTNLTLRIRNYRLKHGLKKLSTPQYLYLENYIADGLRVADAMLKKVS